MLRIYLYDGSRRADICDYCRKQTGKEVIALNITGRPWRNSRSIWIHTECLNKQIDKLRRQGQ